MTQDELIKKLESKGFEFVEETEEHLIFKHADGSPLFIEKEVIDVLPEAFVDMMGNKGSNPSLH